MSRYALIAVLAFSAISLFAQNNRSAVSSLGIDTNPCTIASPCRSFVAAVQKTNAGGEIIAIDSAGYGPFTIDKALTVSGAPGVHAAITATSGSGISVSAASTDRVIVRHLALTGAGGAFGITASSGLELEVTDCVVGGFQNAQIGASDVSLVVDHCTADASPFGTGMFLVNTTGNGNIRGTILNSLIDAQFTGVLVQGQASMIVAHSAMTNSAFGAEAASVSSPGGTAELTLSDCILAHNTNGVATATGMANEAHLYLDRDTLSYNATAVSISGGTVFSFGNNALSGNASDGAPLAPTVLK